MRSIGEIAAILAVSALFAAPAIAAPAVTETAVTYKVSGVTPAELRASINGLRPADRLGQRFDAVTAWRIGWHVKFDTGPHVCSIAGVTVDVVITTTLPELDDGPAPPELRERFASYLVNLKTHERGHRDNVVAVGGEIERALLGMSGRPDCPTLLADANALGHGLLDQARQRDADYDKATAHGATQGARFP